MSMSNFSSYHRIMQFRSSTDIVARKGVRMFKKKKKNQCSLQGKQLRNRHYWWIKNSSLFSHGKGKKYLKTVFIVSQLIVSQRPCPSAYICPVLSRITMENKIIQARKDPQASAHTDRCPEVPSNFPHLPRTRTTDSELWTQALSFLLCLELFFHLLNLFLLFFYKQTRKEILLKPFTNLQKYKKSPILVPFSHLAFPSHILQLFLGHFSSPACLTDFLSSLMIFPSPKPE